MRLPPPRPIPPLMHLFLMLGGDFVSTIVFAVAFARTHSLGLSLGVSLASGVAGLAWTLLRGRKPDAMQGLSLGLVVVFGGVGLLTHDARFVMFKPTVIYLAVAAVMLKPGWMRRYMPAKAAPHSARVSHVFGYAWAAGMAGIAAVNLALAVHGDLRLWGGFLAVGPIAIKAGLGVTQYFVTRARVVAAIRSERQASMPLAA